VTHARTMLVLGFAGGFVLSGLGIEFSNAQDRLVTRTGLLKVDLSSVEGTEAVAYIANLAPGASIGKHVGHGDEFVYVLEGALIVEPVGKKSIALKSGQVAYMPFTMVHADRNGSTSQPTKFLVFAVAEKDKP
jgi:quercetin dioxygenase-like cupin family protein